MISDVIPDIIPPDLQHVLWVGSYPLRGIDQLIARKPTLLANLVTNSMGLEFRHVLLRFLEHLKYPRELVKKDWGGFDFLPAISLHKSRCICSHIIEQLCFIVHIPTKIVFLVGNHCVGKIKEFEDIARHNDELIKIYKKNEQAEKKAEEKRKLMEEVAEKKAEERRKLMEEIAKKIEDEAEEQRIAIQKIDDILKCCPRDTFANSVKQQVIAGSKVSSKQMVVIEEIYVKKKVKATLDLW